MGMWVEKGIDTGHIHPAGGSHGSWGIGGVGEDLGAGQAEDHGWASDPSAVSGSSAENHGSVPVASES